LLAGLGLQVIVDVASGKLELKGGWQWYFWTVIGLAFLVFILTLAFDRHETRVSWLVLAIVPLAWMFWPASARPTGYWVIDFYCWHV
jgi:hypothetical protein